MSEAGTTIQPLDPGELLRRIEVLERELTRLRADNEALRAEVERLRRQQRRQAAPFSKERPGTTRKRPGRKAGQGHFSRRLAPPAAAGSDAATPVPVAETACPACGGELTDDGTAPASVTDLPARPVVEVRRYQVARRRCAACGTRVWGTHPDLAPDQRGATAHRLGPRLLAAAQTLHYDHGVPVRRVPAVLADLTGAHVTQSALTHAALRQANRAVGTVYAALRQEVAQAERVHTDDTGWRVGGKPAQLMAFTTETATVYQIRSRHRHEEVLEVIPADYAGVLSTDRGRSYDAAALASVKQQKCVAHLLRSVSEVLETKWGRGRSLGLHLRRVLRDALALWQAQRAGTAADFVAEAQRLQAELGEVLRARTLPDPDNQRLLDQLGWHHARGNLLRFLDDPRIEPTNNRAERALRPAVIARKVSQCSKTETGAEAFAAFASVARTTRQQSGSVLDRLTALQQPASPSPPSPR